MYDKSFLTKQIKIVNSNCRNSSLPSSTDSNVGAANGLADLQEFHGIDQNDLINGQITNYVTGETYLSKSKLTSNEVLKIGPYSRFILYYTNKCFGPWVRSLSRQLWARNIA